VDVFELTAVGLIVACAGVSILANMGAWAIRRWRMRLEREWGKKRDTELS